MKLVVFHVSSLVSCTRVVFWQPFSLISILHFSNLVCPVVTFQILFEPICHRVFLVNHTSLTTHSDLTDEANDTLYSRIMANHGHVFAASPARPSFHPLQSEWVSSFLTAHQSSIGHFSAMTVCENDHTIRHYWTKAHILITMTL